jgi:CheY-like chemotaxis protein
LGEILRDADLITEPQLGQALALQRAYGERLASILVRQRVLTEKFAVTYLGRQVGMPAVDLSKQDIDLGLLELVPLKLCERHQVFPIRVEGTRLQLAMADPSDQLLVSEIEVKTGVRLQPMIALEAAVKNAIAEARRALRDGRRRIQPNMQRGREHDELPTPSAGIPVAPANESTRATSAPERTPAALPLSRLEPREHMQVESLAGAPLRQPRVALDAEPEGLPVAASLPAPAAPPEVEGPRVRPEIPGAAPSPAPAPPAPPDSPGARVRPEIPSAIPPARLEPAPAVIAARPSLAIADPDFHVEGEAPRFFPDGGPEVVARALPDPVPPSAPRPEPAATAPRPLDTAPPLAPRAPLLLVVDDDEMIQLLLVQLFEGAHYRVITAGSGREALARLRDQAPDLVVLDGMLPEVHGFEICRQIKSSERFRHIPVVLLSAVHRGWRFAADVQERYGADGYVEKPFEPFDLLRRVDALLGRAPAPSDDSDLEVTRALREGMHALKQADLEPAIRAFTRGLETAPTHTLLHYHLALCFDKKGMTFHAIDHYEQAIQHSPTFYDAIVALANLYQQQQFNLKAVEMWELALRATQDTTVRQRIKEHLLSLL